MLLGLAFGVSSCQGDNPLDDNFDAQLTVTVTGTGSGTVSVLSDPWFSGFTCSTADGECTRSADLDVGSGERFVVLRATPAAGSLFVAWEGECIPDDVDPDESTIDMPTETGYVCTATFDRDPAACVNPVVIADDFAAGTGWSTVVSASNGNVTQAVTTEAAGGNPGGFRRMQHLFTGAASIAVYHAYDAVTYNPATQGAIDHLEYSEDQIVINPPFAGAAVGTGFFLLQGGTRYSIGLNPPGNAFNTTTWAGATRAPLTAADFPGVDFSASGAPITFGYFRSNSNDGGTSTVTHGIDDFRVQVCR